MYVFHACIHAYDYLLKMSPDSTERMRFISKYFDQVWNFTYLNLYKYY